MNAGAPAITDDAILGGRLRLLQPERGHRAGSDAVLLAAAARVEPGGRIADFGSGVGTAGLAVLLRVPGTAAVLVEIDAAACELAMRNAQRNGLDARTQIVQADVAMLGKPGGAGINRVDHVIANPPFHPAAGRVSPQPETALARMSAPGLLDRWIASAVRVLRPGGGLTLIHRPDALAEIIAALDRRFGGVAIRAVHARAGEAAVRLIVTARAGSRAPLSILPPLVLNGEGGGFTPEAAAIHRDLAALV